MEQQTMTGSGLYILIAVQLLFSMLIQLRIRQYRKKPTGCLPAVLVILSTAVFTSVLYYIWQIVCDENSCWTDLGGMLAAGSWQEWVAWAFFGLFVVLFTFGYMGLLAFLFKFNGSKLDAYILEDIERSYRRIEETNEKGGKQ